MDGVIQIILNCILAQQFDGYVLTKYQMFERKHNEMHQERKITTKYNQRR